MAESKASRPLTYEQVASRLRYEPETGKLYWIKSLRCHHLLGQRAGCLTPIGYRYIHLSGVTYPEHRIAWLMATKEWALGLDHINGVRDDNRFVNLRLATMTQNNQHVRAQRNRASKYKGVWRRKKKWTCYITIEGKRRRVGTFAHEDEAGRAYDKVAKEAFGEFAVLNFPMEAA